MTSQISNSYARTAGALYLVIAVAGAFSIGYVPSVIIDTSNAAVTVNNLMENAALFKFGILGDVVVLLVEVVLTAMLYIMFKQVSPTLSLIAGWARLAMVLVMAMNILFNIMPVFLLNGAPSLNGFDTGQLQSTAMIFFQMHEFGVYIWQLFFALHLVALGALVIKSGLVPKFLGYMLMLGSFGYFIQGLAKITGTEHSMIIALYIGLLILVTVAELALALWFLIKGVRTVGKS